MFPGLFVQNSTANELFYQGPEERQEDDDEGDEEYLKYPRQKSQNFHNTPTTKMAVNNSTSSKAMKVAMSLRDTKDESLDKKTPSLEQEMNLARRACWCSSKGKGDEEDGDEGVKGCCENCFNNSNNQNDNVDDDDDIANDNDKTTTVLNGAKLYSKNIIINDNGSANYIDNINDNANANDNTMNSKTTTTLTTNSLRKRCNSKHNKDVQPEASSDDVITDSSTSHKEDTALQHDSSATSIPKKSSSLDYLRIVLLNCWLAFVAFCDRNTIKRNDPRFEVYRQTQLVATQQTASTSNNSMSSSASSSSSSSTTSNKPRKAFQFKLLTSKKVIFLLLVCFFFSCLNRIEARPNSSNSDGNAIGSSGAAGVESVATAAVPVANGVAGGAEGSPIKSTAAGGDGNTNVSRFFKFCTLIS